MSNVQQEVLVLSALVRGRKRITDPRRHCQGRMAVDWHGADIQPTSPLAQQWCAAGAIVAEVGTASFDPVCQAAFNRLNRYCFSFAKVNDELGHAAILQVIDTAIAELERELGLVEVAVA